MSQKENDRYTMQGCLMAPFVFGGGFLFLIILTQFSKETGINGKLLLFLATIAFVIFTIYVEHKRDQAK